MSTHVLTITYQQPAAPVDPYWVRIQQEDLADQTATVADAAALLDALYRIEPCADGQSTPELVSDLAEAVAETEILAYCGQEPDGSVEVELDVIRSHLAEPYRLRLQGGEVVKTVEVAERVTVRMEIGATVTLDYPVVSGFACDPEPLARVGNTLSFAADHVGRGLTATYLSRWDRVTVKVLGVDGKAGSCRALAFHHGLVADVELQVPDADEVDRLLCPATRWEIDWGNQEVTCYQDVTVIRQCNCSETEADRYTYQQVVPCPNPEMRCPGAESRCMHLVGSKEVTEWVECQGDNAIPGRPGATYAVSSPEYYRRVCCQDPPGSLPQCEVKHTTYQGEIDIQHGRQYWRDLYGDHARFVPVPPPGGICGEWIIRQVIDPKDCCDRIPPLRWDDAASPDYIAADSTAWVYVRDGLPPYKWHISSEQGGVWFVDGGGSDYESEVPFAALRSGDSVCGTHTITVVDDCGTEVQGAVLGPEGHWEGEAVAMRDIAASGYLHFGHGVLVDDGANVYVELMVAGVRYRQTSFVCEVVGTDGNSELGIDGCPTDRSQFSAWWTDEPGGDPSYRPMPDIAEDVVRTSDCGTCYGYDRYGVLTFEWQSGACGSAVKTVETSPHLLTECIYLAGTGGQTCKMDQVRFCYGDFGIWRWKC